MGRRERVTQQHAGKGLRVILLVPSGPLKEAQHVDGGSLCVCVFYLLAFILKIGRVQCRREPSV